MSVEKIDSRIGETRDIPDLNAVFATKNGYQSGAKTKADTNKIDLLIVREQNDTDWTDVDGTPLIKKICINLQFYMPAKISKFEPVLDGDWIKENIEMDAPLSISGLNYEIFIEDLNKDHKHSIHELASKLAPLDGKEFGVFEKEEKFENAFIYYKDLKLKIASYKIEYSIENPIDSPIELDFSKELIGVV